MNAIAKKDEPDVITRIIHLGILTFGILAYLTSEWAESYKQAEHLGFDIHKWLGIGLAFFILLRAIFGFVGPRNIRFSQWVPYTKDRLLPAWQDILTLLRLRLPERPTHQGLAGIVQTFGLLVFLWMASTGTLMFFYLEPGQEARKVLHSIKELHEVGEAVLPVFLVLHIGAVVLHALAGRHLWRKMFFLKEQK